MGLSIHLRGVRTEGGWGGRDHLLPVQGLRLDHLLPRALGDGNPPRLQPIVSCRTRRGGSQWVKWISGGFCDCGAGRVGRSRRNRNRISRRPVESSAKVTRHHFLLSTRPSCRLIRYNLHLLLSDTFHAKRPLHMSTTFDCRGKTSLSPI